MSPSGNPFGPQLIRFLKELEENNDRRWFEAKLLERFRRTVPFMKWQAGALGLPF